MLATRPPRARRADALRRRRGGRRAARRAAASTASGIELTDGWAGALRPEGQPVPEFSAHRPGREDGHERVAARRAGRVRVRLLDLPRHVPGAGADDPRRARRPRDADVRVIGISVDPANDNPERAKSFLLKQSMTGRMDFLMGTRDAARAGLEGLRDPAAAGEPRALGAHGAGRRPRLPARSASRSTTSPTERLAHDLGALCERPLRSALVRRRVAPVSARRAGRVREGPPARPQSARTSSRRPARARRCSASS